MAEIEFGGKKPRNCPVTVLRNGSKKVVSQKSWEIK